MANEPQPKFRRHAALRRWVPLFGLIAGSLLLWWVIGKAGGMPWRRLKDAWPVMLFVLPWFVLPLAAAAESWRALFTSRRRLPFSRAVRLTWIGLGVNWLLPVAMVGGEVIKYRLGRGPGGGAPALIASLVGDKTQQVISQIGFSFCGIVLLTVLHRGGGVLLKSAGLLFLLALAVYFFYRLQQAGVVGAIATRFRRSLPSGDRLEATARRIDAEIRALYRRRADWWRALAWRFLFRLLFAAEIVGVLVYFDVEWHWLEVLAIESLAQGARAAAFLIPAGIGAQESALIGAGLLLGLPGETLLIAALIKRSRELIVGAAALIAWQVEEGRRFISSSNCGLRKR